MLEESYYHDTSHPVSSSTLDEIFQAACEENVENYIVWAKPYEKMTHQQLYQEVTVLAKGLLAIGLKKGDTFCSFGSQGSDSVILLLACCALGIKYTANYLYTPISKVITMMITKIQPDAVLIGNCNSGKRQEHVCTEFVKVLNQISKDGSHDTPHILYDRKAESDVSFGTYIQKGWRSLSSIMKLGQEMVSDEMLISAKSLVTIEDPILYLCSSGSTGEPKIVTCTVGTFSVGLVYFQLQSNNREAIIQGCNDVIEGDVKLILIVFRTLAARNNLIVFPPHNSKEDSLVLHEVLSTIEKYRVQVFIYHMEYVTMIADNPEYKVKYDLSCLQAMTVSGCLSSIELKKKLLSFAPYSVDAYGATEFLFSMKPTPLKLLPPSKLTTVGKACPNVEMKVIDESGAIVPVNIKGQLCVRGWPLFLEYKDQPELTAKAKGADGWYQTGDMVAMDEEGYLYLYGRMSNAQRWKVNDKVIYSISIESVLMKHPSIRCSVVVGTDNGKGHDLNYIIVPAPESDLTLGDVKEYAIDQMYNSLEWPVRIFFYTYDQLPKTSGARQKVQRDQLIEQISNRVGNDPSDGLV